MDEFALRICAIACLEEPAEGRVLKRDRLLRTPLGFLHLMHEGAILVLIASPLLEEYAEASTSGLISHC